MGGLIADRQGFGQHVQTYGHRAMGTDRIQQIEIDAKLSAATAAAISSSSSSAMSSIIAIAIANAIDIAVICSGTIRKAS